MSGAESQSGHHRQANHGDREPCEVEGLTGAALFRQVETYAALGPHRSASAGDHATTDWMEASLDALGYRVVRKSFLIDRLNAGSCWLVWAGQRLSVHLQPPVPTPVPTDVGGVLVGLDYTAQPPGDLAGRIAVAAIGWHVGGTLADPQLHDWLSAVGQAGAEAAVLITEGPTGEVIALNTRYLQAPYGCPVVLTAPRDAAFLHDAVRSGDHAVLHLAADVTPDVAAYNLIAARDGVRPSIIISTPQSGWFDCAAERGPGIALLLGLAEWAAADGHDQIGFVITSGHELGDQGAHHLVQTPPFDLGAIDLWMHLGAGIAAYDWDFASGERPVRLSAPYAKRFLVTNDTGLLDPLRTGFAGQPGLETPHHVLADRLPGETGVYMRGPMKRVVGILSGHIFHHTPEDTPQCTGPDILAPVAAGLRHFLDDFMASQAVAQ